MNADCNNLDAFLAADLSEDEVVRFVQHLKCCDDCRDAVDEQRWIDGLLRSSATLESELPPEDVLLTLHTSIATRRQKTKLFACGLTAAAMLAVAVGWTVLNRQADDWASDSDDRLSIATNEMPRATQSLLATFVSDSGAIAVPVKSRHSDVTIMRIYPAYQPLYDNQTAAFEPEAATNDNWNVYSNGG